MSTISEDEAHEILCDSSVARQTISEHRWYTKQLIVYRRDEELMGFYYLDPATEEQEGQDVFESDPIEVFPVIARQVVTTVYKPG